MKLRPPRCPFLVMALALSLPAVCRADVKLPGIFGNHMILQQDLKIPVWGWADAGEAVTVTLGDHTGKTTADAAGKWRVDLTPLPTGTAALNLVVTGKNTLTLEDVLVGDVWICGGQSNMEFGMNRAHNFGTEIPKANDPQLRLFVVNKVVALDPVPDAQGKWMLCTPESVAGFSAVGYFFGRELRQKLNRPIGLIADNWGGTPAQAWTSLEALQQDPPFSTYLLWHQRQAQAYLDNKDKFPAQQAAYTDDVKKWKDQYGTAYDALMVDWNVQAKAAFAAGQQPPPRPPMPAPMPKAPTPPEGGPNTPSVLFNGMIAPIIPFAIKGVIWYQGESNAGMGIEYQTLFPRMITDWRTRWNEGDFPFLYVQLANYMAAQKAPSEGGWALVRDSQRKTLSLPATGMAVAIDIGNAGDIHPRDKIDVGQRLALVARHVAYGENLVYSGPLYDSMKVEGTKIRLTFTNVGGGLQMSVPPWTPDGVPMPPPPTELTGFAIAGADQNFVWAKASIEGGTIVVSSDTVTAPVAVRYGWANNPPCNLYNKEGLPASPFRTDDWDVTPPAPTPVPVVPPPTPAPAKT